MTMTTHSDIIILVLGAIALMLSFRQRQGAMSKSMRIALRIGAIVAIISALYSLIAAKGP